MSPGPLARTLREALLRRAADRSGRFVPQLFRALRQIEALSADVTGVSRIPPGGFVREEGTAR